jgi:nucleoside-diphosphate-sugar epimerase
MRELLPAFYDSIVRGGECPVPMELVRAVSEAEDAVVSQIGKTQYECRPVKRPAVKPDPIVVTGASGYVGQEVVKRLTERGYGVRALVRHFSDTSALEALGAELVWGDIRDYAAVSRACLGARAIVHLAAGLRGGARFIAQSCIDGTGNVARVAREHVLGTVVYVSSVGVYDLAALPEGSVIKEDARLESDPKERGASSAAKRAAEDIALREAEERGWTVLRPGMIFGNGRALLPLLGGAKIGRLFVSFGLPGNGFDSCTCRMWPRV